MIFEKICYIKQFLRPSVFFLIVRGKRENGLNVPIAYCFVQTSFLQFGEKGTMRLHVF